MTALAASTRAYYGDPVLVTPPAALPLSLAELKVHCKIDSADEDALVMWYQRSGVDWIQEWADLALITQTWREAVSAFPTRTIELRKRPVQAVTSIDYLDAGNVAATLDPSVYVVGGIGSSKRYGKLTLGSASAWPSVYAHTEAVTITYRAGFGDTHNDVPELIRHALAIYVKTSYEFRDEAAFPANAWAAIKNLLAEWRPFGIA